MLPTETEYDDPVSDAQPRVKKRTKRETQDFMALARERRQQADESDEHQRDREREDIKLYNGDQWPEEEKRKRGAQVASGGVPATGARPTLVVNIVREPVRQVINDERDSDIGIEITPADDFGDLDILPDNQEIALREGLLTRIQRTTDAAAARTWAFARACIAGRGYYAVMTRYLDGKTNDKEIYVMRIYNQDDVWMDPAHEEPDGSDAEWEGVGAWIPWHRYKAQYPHSAKNPNKISAASEDTFDGWCRDTPEWVRAEGSLRSVYVTDYYYTEYESRELCTLLDGSVMWADELADADEALVVDRRTCIERKVKWAKLDGINDDPLEETDWESPFLPIIKVLGEELQPHDGERRAEGIVRPARDSQIGLNWMVSKLVEMVGQTPNAALVFDPESIENWQDWYKAAVSGRPLWGLPVKTSDENGRPYREPHRPNADPNIVPATQGIALFRQMVQSTTQVPAAALGDIDPVTRSGNAIKALTANSRHSTSNFTGNLTRSVHYEAQIENSLLYPIYGTRPGRIARIVNGQGDAEAVMIHQPFMKMGGLPRPVMMPAPTGGMVPMPMDHPQVPEKAQTYRLTKDATFNIAIKVTRKLDTKRQEEAEFLGNLIQAEPQQMAVYGDLLFRNLDVPGHKELEERAKLMLAPPVQQYLAQKQSGQTPTPTEMHLQTENAQLKQKLQEAGQIIQTKGVEQQGKLAITQAQETAETQRADKDREAKIAVAVIAALQKQQGESLQIFYEERARIGEQAASANLDARQKAHELALAAVTAATGAAQSAQDHRQQIQQDAHSAALAPTPVAAPPAEGQPA